MSTLVAADSWKFEDNGARVEIDTQRTGQITRWEFGGKVLVDAKAPASPLNLETISGERYAFAAQESSQEQAGDARIVRVRGRLSDGRRSTPANIAYRVEESGRRIRATIQFEKSGDVEAVCELSWTLPLALEPRKRIWFRGDHNIEWDTRYFYQFMTNTTYAPLTRPERNEWRYFGLDQLGPNAFRLWKAESTQTSPLVMQEGKSAAPAVQLYNQSGGVTVEYSGLVAGAPQSLRVDAAGGAEVKALFHARSTLPARLAQIGAVGASQEIVLTAHESEAAALAAQKEVSARYASTPRPSPQDVMQEEKWLRETPQAAAPQYVTGGYPFAPGELRDAKNLRVAVGGQSVPVQAKASAFWPDGSLKWVLLTFPVDATRAVNSCPAPRVSLRDGKFLPVAITQNPNAAPVQPIVQSALKVSHQDANSARIVNGDWSVELATGTQWLRALRYKNQSLLRGNSQPRLAYSDYLLNPTEVLPYEREATGGQRDAGVLKVEKIEVEETGPLRAVVRLEGMTDNAEATRIILRIEVFAGRPELRLTHSAEFRFKDPRQTFLTGMGVSLPLAGEVPGAVNLNGTTVANVDNAGALQTSHAHGEVRSNRGREWQVAAQNGEARGWAQLENGAVEITGVIRNFRETAPKALTVDNRAGALRFELWPEDAPPMDVRRYSNFPHRSQGESVPADEDWVQEHYYPADPFIGITRTHEMLVAFWPKAAAPTPQTLAADFQSPPLLYAGWEKYEGTKVVLPVADAKEWPRAWDAWTRLANFWLWHRELHQWNGFWTFGDIRHLFQSGYGWRVEPETMAKERPWEKPKEKLPREVVHRDYQPPNDWAYDNGRWGWGSTEGLPNLFLQQEYLRHGNRAVYFAAEALARISRDVVTRHEGKWFGAGTRHGVQHWSDGNHEERQTTVTEYRLHYFLSGDGRSRDTIHKLYNGVYSKKPVSVHAAHSGRLGGLLFHWEITGSPEEFAQLQRYVQTFVSPDGLYTTPVLNFPGPVADGPPRDLNGNSMFFHYFGAMHALIEYHQITRDPQLAAALIKMADAAMSTPDVARRYKTGKNGGFWPAIAFAAANAPDPAPYREFMREYIEAGGWQNFYQSVTQDPAHWSGETGWMFGNVPSSWFWNNWAPYIAHAQNTPEIWTKEVAAKFEQNEKSGDAAPRLRPSWQTEYDGIPELEEFLGSQQPWKNQ